MADFLYHVIVCCKRPISREKEGISQKSHPRGGGDWEIFVFNRPQGKGFGWGFVTAETLKNAERKGCNLSCKEKLALAKGTLLP